VVSAATYRCPWKWVKRSPRICGMDGHDVAVGASSCVPELPSAAFKAPVVLDQSYGIAFSGPVLMLLLTEPISFGMD